MAGPRIVFLEPWVQFSLAQAEAFLRELQSELSVDHPLRGHQLNPLGHSGAADDALFELEDGQIVEVHLTFSGHTEPAPFPRFRIYPNPDEWVQRVMLAANSEYMGS